MSDKTMPSTGGCMCGAERYEAMGEPLEVGHCHCHSCRRQTGAPVVTWVTFEADKVRFAGRTRSIHKSSPGVERAFCGQCGTPLTWEGRSRAWDRSIIEFYISTFDDPDGFVPDQHWFHEERIDWFDVADCLPRYRGVGMKDEEPYRHGPAIEGPQAVTKGRRKEPAMSDKTLPITGGCLCGAVRYETTGESFGVIHCHCHSCRKHNGAPVATLAVFKVDQVNFSGDERKIYESSPNVGRAFCAKCGTPLTWETVFGDLGPLRSLHISTFDDPDALMPTAHSFYSERISWFDIADNLPRYEGFVVDGSLLRYGPAIAEPSG